MFVFANAGLQGSRHAVNDLGNGKVTMMCGLAGATTGERIGCVSKVPPVWKTRIQPRVASRHARLVGKERQ
jgi:hypothetical protein